MLAVVLDDQHAHFAFGKRPSKAAVMTVETEEESK